jgi:acyl-CoA synthetase (AMP-forming)/AMP-acid ligase II
MDLRVLLDMAVAFDPDRVAVSGVAGERVSTGELDSLARRAAERFLATRRSHVAFFGTNGPAMPVALFGSAIAGVPFVPLNYRLADSQLARVVESHDFVGVASDGGAERLRRLGVQQVIDPDVLCVPTTGPDGPSLAPRPDASSDDVALFVYTSGTTSTPKAAVLRHRHVASYVVTTVEFGAAAASEAALLSVPPYHVAGVMNLLTNLYLGRRVVYLDPFDPRRWLELVRSEAVTHAMVVPTMLSRIVSALDGVQADVPSLRSLSYGGAKMPKSVIEAALRLFPAVDFTNAYGLTETTSTVTVLGPDCHRQALHASDPLVHARLHSAGRPLPGIELEVRDEEGAPCEPGAVGDIYVRGEHVAGEYAGGPGAGSDWFATRDRGHLDQDGYLFIEGRADDTIIRGGENIAPAEIEDVLVCHGQVTDCAVVGVDDEEWGQRIAAAVVLAPGATVSTDDVRQFAKERLRSSKTPDLVVVLDTLPYTETGKLLRRAVREALAAQAVPSSST